jgi:hypothetical protein
MSRPDPSAASTTRGAGSGASPECASNSVSKAGHSTPATPPEPSAAQGQRDPFADDVLERLARSNQDYQREHGHYIVPLAERLLAARAENERLRAKLAEYDKYVGEFTRHA